MGNESSKRVNQNRLAWSKVVDDVNQLCSAFSDAPVVGSTLLVDIQSLLPIRIIRSGGSCGDVGHNRVVMQKMLSPTALSTAGWSADQNQAAGLTGYGWFHVKRGFNHRHSSPSASRRKTEKHG